MRLKILTENYLDKSLPEPRLSNKIIGDSKKRVGENKNKSLDVKDLEEERKKEKERNDERY